MRSNKELLQIYLDNKHLFSDGLCSWTDVLYVGLITDEERRYLKSIIFNNRPKIGHSSIEGLNEIRRTAFSLGELLKRIANG